MVCFNSFLYFLFSIIILLSGFIYSADYILLLVLWDHGIYSESSELIIRLDSFSKQI